MGEDRVRKERRLGGVLGGEYWREERGREGG